MASGNAEEAAKLCIRAADLLDELQTMVGSLETLGYPFVGGILQAEPPFDLRANRIAEEAEEIRAAAAGRTSPRSLRLQREADEREREQRERLKREAAYADRNQQQPTAPPKGWRP